MVKRLPRWLSLVETHQSSWKGEFNYSTLYITSNSMARKLPIQKCMGKIAVQLKSHGENEIARN